jgi:multicomponent Na+:H+ antiporter subunit C
MEVLLALAVGVLYGSGTYLMLRRSLLKLVIGLGLLANGTNLLIFTSAGLSRAGPPIIEEGQLGTSADPLPQALILTAIVITFGVTAFALVLLRRAYAVTASDDPDLLDQTDRL